MSDNEIEDPEIIESGDEVDNEDVLSQNDDIEEDNNEEEDTDINGNDDSESESDLDIENHEEIENDDSNHFNKIVGGVSKNTSDNKDDLDLDEDILGVNSKKIVHHDDILLLHPESKFHNYDEISAAAVVTRNENNIIIDKLHSTVPILFKYEKAKILGQRVKQLDAGNKPFVKVTKPTMDNSIIAEEELNQKKLPFIIQRPIPGGGVEYWHVKDLEVL